MKLVSLKKVNVTGSRIKGVAEIMLDNGKILEDIRILNGDHGLFIAFVNNKVHDQPEEKDFYQKIEKIIFDEYNK